MIVIGFFRDVLSNLGTLVEFISTPLGKQFPEITIEPFASSSIMSLLGVSLVATLGILLVAHLIRLFIGG